MGEEVQPTNRIYRVVRPERNAVKWECNMALAYFSENFYLYLLKDFVMYNFDFSIANFPIGVRGELENLPSHRIQQIASWFVSPFSPGTLSFPSHNIYQ